MVILININISKSTNYEPLVFPLVYDVRPKRKTSHHQHVSRELLATLVSSRYRWGERERERSLIPME